MMTQIKQESQEEAVKRLKIIEGHLKKITQMVKESEYCPNIIQQSNAVQCALRKVDELLMEGHLNACFKNAIKSGGGDKQIQELLEAFKKR